VQLLSNEYSTSFCWLLSPPFLRDVPLECTEFLSGSCLAEQRGCFLNNVTKPFSSCTVTLASHLDYSFVEQARLYNPSMSIRTLTMVRHPVKRYVSGMAYLLKCVEYSAASSFFLGRRDDVARSMRANSTDNLTAILLSYSNYVMTQSKFFAGVSSTHCGTRPSLDSEHYEVAMSNARKFSFIGVLERAPESMRLLQRVLNLRHTPVLPRVHACHNKDLSSVSTTVLNTLATMYPAEMAFYESLVNLFEQSLLSLS
jgi:hypothetical protein